jgi:glycine/D-amino acid oxidase-like deaminating enzyme
VFEQAAIPNPLGSSVDQHRLIRYPYGAAAGYCRMIDTAYAAWNRLWADLDGAAQAQRFYAETGTIGIDGPGADWAKRSAASMREAGIPFEALAAGELVRRFPHLRPEGIETALYQPRGGVLLAGRIVESLAHHLGTHGVELRTKTKVVDIDAERARFRLAGSIVESFDRIVIAAGPWVTRLVPALAARVTPSRQIVVYVDPPARQAAAWAAAPMLIEMRSDCAFYCVPPRVGTGLKFGDHRFTLAGDPDREREATRAEAEAMLAAYAARFRDGEAYRIVEAKTCFYDVEPQERFILERLGAGGFVLSGFSGHGFKFGALMGELVAAAVLGEKSADAVRRYAAGEPAGS